MDLDLDQWRELAQPYYEVFPREPKENAGVTAEVATVDTLLATKLLAPAQTLVHDPAVQKGICHDYLLFERFYSGGGKGEVGDVGFTVNSGSLHVIDMSRRYVTAQKRSSSRGVLIPHAAVGFAPGEDPPVYSIGLDSPAGRILAAAHEALWTAKAHDTCDEQPIIASAFLELVRRLMLRRTDDADAAQHRDLPRSMYLRDYVTRHLDNPDLDATYLATELGMSRATFYRHFENTGGVSQYIRNRRLDRCFFELAGATPHRGRIKTIAERWHFKDASHFNRLFRERFGISPSDTLASGDRRMHGAPSELLQLCRTWLGQLTL